MIGEWFMGERQVHAAYQPKPQPSSDCLQVQEGRQIGVNSLNDGVVETLCCPFGTDKKTQELHESQ